MQLPDLSAMIVELQEMLGLRDWKIAAEWVRGLVFPGTRDQVYALCYPDPERREAVIRMRVPETRAELLEVPVTVAHEMAHVLMSPAQIPRVLEEQIVFALEKTIAGNMTSVPILARAMARALPRNGETYNYQPRRVQRRKARTVRARNGYMLTAEALMALIEDMKAKGADESLIAKAEGMLIAAESAEGAPADDAEMATEPPPEDEPPPLAQDDPEEEDEEPMAMSEEKKPMAMGDKDSDPVARANGVAMRSLFMARPWLTDAQKAFAREFEPEKAEAFLNTLPKPSPKPAPEAKPMPRMTPHTEAPRGASGSGHVVRPGTNKQFNRMFKVTMHDHTGKVRAREGITLPGLEVGAEGSPVLASFSAAEAYPMLQAQAKDQYSRRRRGADARRLFAGIGGNQ